MIKFYIVKFEKSLIFQIKEHDFSAEIWADANPARRLRYEYNGMPETIYYNNEPAIGEKYISLNLDYSVYGKKVFKQSFQSNEDRDKQFDRLISAIEYFKKHIKEYSYE